jgi:hypothetical protein
MQVVLLSTITVFDEGLDCLKSTAADRVSASHVTILE